MSAEVGYVYLMVSPGLAEGVIKIGATIHDPVLRARQLSTTSSPLPFVLAYSRRVEHPFKVEAALHRILDPHRISDEREFFKVPLHQAIELIERYEEVRAEFERDDTETPFAKLFATFDQNGPPELTSEEQKKCRELEGKLARSGY